LKNSSQTDLIEVAKIGKTVGLKGVLKLHLNTDFPEQFKAGALFSSRAGDLTVKSYNEKRSEILFEGYDVKEEASKLTNLVITSTFEKTREMCNLGDEEYFWFDIIGLNVYEDAICIGRVQEIERYEMEDQLLIITDEGLVEAGKIKRFLFPYTKRTIMSVDLEKKAIKVQGALDILDVL
jgi:16S rRNA processing protein RimM